MTPSFVGGHEKLPTRGHQRLPIGGNRRGHPIARTDVDSTGGRGGVHLEGVLAVVTEAATGTPIAAESDRAEIWRDPRQTAIWARSPPNAQICIAQIDGSVFARRVRAARRVQERRTRSFLRRDADPS
jgi:hypothetical protein